MGACAALLLLQQFVDINLHLRHAIRGALSTSAVSSTLTTAPAAGVVPRTTRHRRHTNTRNAAAVASWRGFCFYFYIWRRDRLQRGVCKSYRRGSFLIFLCRV